MMLSMKPSYDITPQIPKQIGSISENIAEEIQNYPITYSSW